MLATMRIAKLDPDVVSSLCPYCRLLGKHVDVDDEEAGGRGGGG